MAGVLAEVVLVEEPVVLVEEPVLVAVVVLA